MVYTCIDITNVDVFNEVLLSDNRVPLAGNRVPVADILHLP